MQTFNKLGHISSVDVYVYRAIKMSHLCGGQNVRAERDLIKSAQRGGRAEIFKRRIGT